MSSTASKARTRKFKNVKSKKNGLMSTKDECEITEDSLNTVSTYRRYNLRSYSPSKVPIQLKSKVGRSLNTDSEFLKNENTNIRKKKNKIPDRLSVRETNSSKKYPSNKSCPLKKNAFNKTQIPKYVSPAVINEEYKNDKFEMSSFEDTNTSTPYKSILKKIEKRKSPIKSPYLPTLNEKDIIKERIYGPIALKQKNVKFKTMSCNNLDIIPYENIGSADIQEPVHKCDELNVSSAEDIQETFSGVDSESKKDDSTKKVFVIFENQEDSCGEKLFQNGEDIFEIQANALLPEERKNLYSQAPKNKFMSSYENSQKFELPCQNCYRISDSHSETEEENILNERQSSDKNVFDTNVNNIITSIENFRILADVEFPKGSFPKVKKSQKKRSESISDSQNLPYGDQHDTTSYTEDSFSTNMEENYYDSEPKFGEDKIKNRSHTVFSSFQPRSEDQGDQMQTKHEGTLKEKVEDKVKILTSKFLQEINRKKKESHLKTKRLNDSSITYYDKCDVAHAKLSSGKKNFTKPICKKNSFLTYTTNLSNAEELDSSENDCSFRQKLNLDSNQSDRSPGISKIPRLMQNLDKYFSPLSKMSITPTKVNRIIGDEDVKIQNEQNFSCDPENEQNKTNSVKESLLIPNIKDDKCDDGQTKFSKGKEYLMKRIDEENYFLMHTTHPSYPTKSKTPKKNYSVGQKLKLDVNKTDRSPRISKIPYFTQSQEKFSPLPNMSSTPIKMNRMADDGGAKSQSEQNFSYNFENEQNKMKSLKKRLPAIYLPKEDEEEENLLSTFLATEEESLLTTHLSKEEENLNSLVEEILTTPNNTKASSQSYDQVENDIMTAENENLLAPDISLLSNDAFQSVHGAPLSELNGVFKDGEQNIVFRKRDHLIVKETNQELFKESKVVREERGNQCNTGSSYLGEKNKMVVKKEKISSKARKKKKFVIVFLISFFLSALFFWWLGLYLLENIQH